MSSILFKVLFTILSLIATVATIATATTHSNLKQMVSYQGALQQTKADERSHTYWQRSGAMWNATIDDLVLGEGTTMHGKMQALFMKDRPENRQEIDVREFLLSHQEQQWRLDWGRLEYLSFSETFGPNPLDIINAQDWRDFFYESAQFRSRPQWLMRGSYYFNHLTTELFLSPAPASMIYPTPFSQTDPLQRTGEIQNMPRIAPHDIRPFYNEKEIEYGTRLSYLFPQGGNVSALLFHHHNRRPAYKPILQNSQMGQIGLEEVQKPVNSIGLSASKEVATWIILGDALLTFKDPINRYPLSYQEQDHLQFILGTNCTSLSYLNLIGFQYHYDSVLKHSWISAKMAEDFGNEQEWQTAFTLFQSLHSQSDFWPRLEIAYNNYPWKWENSLDYWMAKEKHGILWPYHNQGQFQTKVSFTF